MFQPWGRDPASTEPRPTRTHPWPWTRWRELDDDEFLRYLKTGEGLYHEVPLPHEVTVEESAPNDPRWPAVQARLAALEAHREALHQAVRTLTRRPPPSPARPEGTGFEGAGE